MSVMTGPLPDTSLVKSVVLTLNLSQNAATYDAGTVSGGDILILEAVAYVSVVGAGFTSVSIQTNDTTASIIMSAGTGVLVAVTAGLNLATYTTKTLLPSTKKIQYTIVGTGSGGTIKLAVRYQPLAAGATLA